MAKHEAKTARMQISVTCGVLRERVPEKLEASFHELFDAVVVTPLFVRVPLQIRVRYHLSITKAALRDRVEVGMHAVTQHDDRPS